MTIQLSSQNQQFVAAIAPTPRVSTSAVPASPAVVVDEAYIRKMVTTNARWAEHAIVALYRHQTMEEQDQETTIEHNAMGFSAFDAEILSSFAKRLLDGRSLTDRQLEVAFKKLGKYARQLYQIAQGKL